MAGRYLITGVQLGIIKVGLIESEGKEVALKELSKILDTQFIGNSEKNIKDDVKNFIIPRKEHPNYPNPIKKRDKK